MYRRFLVALLALAAGAVPAFALEECRLMRMPDIQGDRISFVYAGDLWTVARAGGVAQRLTTHEGAELFPKFSPDGETLAFTGEYDGNTDVYLIPAAGGEPRRLTWHPDLDLVTDFTPDGKHVVFESPRAVFTDRFRQIYTVPVTGGVPQRITTLAPSRQALVNNRDEPLVVARLQQVGHLMDHDVFQAFSGFLRQLGVEPDALE